MNYTKKINENQIMVPIPIKNKYVLDALNNFLWFWNNPDFLDNIRVSCAEKNIEDGWTSEKHMREIMAQGNTHDGFPDVCKARGMKPDRQLTKSSHSKAVVAECIQKWGDFNSELGSALSARNNALGVIYPPGGFISWHNNHNAPGYNLIFTYADADTGFFEYWDSSKEEVVRLYDTPGEWTCKAGYFAAMHEPIEKKVYHSASAPTDSRMTISYVFARDEMADGLHDETIEEIMTDF